MRKTYLMLILSFIICGCSNQNLPWQVTHQMQYTMTHTGYADSATLHYALDNEITPDSADVLHDEHKW